MLIVSLAAFLLLPLLAVGPVSTVFSQISNPNGVTINLLPDSSPRFFECDTTPINGSSSITGLDPEASAQNVLTDRNPDTAIMGDARFTVNFDKSLFNNPGPELSIIELHGAESFEVSATMSNNANGTISISPQPANGMNSCKYSLNQALIDIRELGVPEGSSVSSISIDNRGQEDTLFGSDISDISILAPGRNDSILAPVGNDSSVQLLDTETILLESYTLPENDYIPLYDSSPFKIMDGHVVAKLPCDESNSIGLSILIGQAPNFVPAEFEFIGPRIIGDLCVYRADLTPDARTPITDIAIQNNSTDNIDFPETSSLIISADLRP